MIPEKIDGLIVPVAASTTHVAFSSIRMEPTWMCLGQAAGVAAHLAIAKGRCAPGRADRRIAVDPAKPGRRAGYSGTPGRGGRKCRESARYHDRRPHQVIPVAPSPPMKPLPIKPGLIVCLLAGATAGSASEAVTPSPRPNRRRMLSSTRNPVATAAGRRIKGCGSGAMNSSSGFTATYYKRRPPIIASTARSRVIACRPAVSMAARHGRSRRINLTPIARTSPKPSR